MAIDLNKTEGDKPKSGINLSKSSESSETQVPSSENLKSSNNKINLSKFSEPNETKILPSSSMSNSDNKINLSKSQESKEGLVASKENLNNPNSKNNIIKSKEFSNGDVSSSNKGKSGKKSNNKVILYSLFGVLAFIVIIWFAIPKNNASDEQIVNRDSIPIETSNSENKGNMQTSEINKTNVDQAKPSEKTRVSNIAISEYNPNKANTEKTTNDQQRSEKKSDVDKNIISNNKATAITNTPNKQMPDIKASTINSNIPNSKVNQAGAKKSKVSSNQENHEINSDIGEKSNNIPYKKNEVYIIYKFPFGNSDCSQSNPQLDKLVNFMTQYSNMNIKIYAYTDNIGAIDFNQRLSEMRAKAICEYIINHGISSSRIIYEGKGISTKYPIREDNRVAEFILNE